MANAILTTGGVGARLDIAVRRGSPMAEYAVTLFADEAASVPIDLTGAVLKAAVRGRGDLAAVIVPIAIGVDDPTTGAVRLNLGAEETIALPGPDNVLDAPTVYDWGFSVTDTSGFKAPVFYGEFEVHGSLPE